MTLNFQNIIELADGDTVYQKHLVELYIEFLTDFCQTYRNNLRLCSYESLRAFAHKSKPSISFLNLEALDRELENMLGLLQNDKVSPTLATESIARIEEACNYYKSQLGNYFSDL